MFLHVRAPALVLAAQVAQLLVARHVKWIAALTVVVDIAISVVLFLATLLVAVFGEAAVAFV